MTMTFSIHLIKCGFYFQSCDWASFILPDAWKWIPSTSVTTEIFPVAFPQHLRHTHSNNLAIMQLASSFLDRGLSWLMKSSSGWEMALTRWIHDVVNVSLCNGVAPAVLEQAVVY